MPTLLAKGQCRVKRVSMSKCRRSGRDTFYGSRGTLRNRWRRHTTREIFNQRYIQNQSQVKVRSKLGNFNLKLPSLGISSLPNVQPQGIPKTAFLTKFLELYF